MLSLDPRKSWSGDPRRRFYGGVPTSVILQRFLLVSEGKSDVKSSLVNLLLAVLVEVLARIVARVQAHIPADKKEIE